MDGIWRVLSGKYSFSSGAVSFSDFCSDFEALSRTGLAFSESGRSDLGSDTVSGICSLRLWSLYWGFNKC